MKTAVKKPKNSKPNLYDYRRPYPNAADPSYFLNKLVDTMLAVVTGMGSISVLLFLITM